MQWFICYPPTRGSDNIESPLRLDAFGKKVSHNVLMSSLLAPNKTVNPSSRDKSHDEEQNQRLVAAMPMVHRAVREFSSRVPRFVDREELVAAGMLGLTQANRAYDAAKGVPFEVYARTRVTGAILDDLRSRDWLTRNQRGKAKIVIEAMRDMQNDNSEITNHLSHPSVEEIARRTKLPVAEVRIVLSDLDRAQRMGHTGEISDPAIAEVVRSHDAGPLDNVLDAEAVENVRGAVQAAAAATAQGDRGRLFRGPPDASDRHRVGGDPITGIAVVRRSIGADASGTRAIG